MKTFIVGLHRLIVDKIKISATPSSQQQHAYFLMWTGGNSGYEAAVYVLISRRSSHWIECR